MSTSSDQVAAAVTQAPVSTAGKTVASTLGEIVWLMTQSAEHKSVPIGDLERLVMPAILLRQFRLYYEKEQPVAAVLYARVSSAMKARVEANAQTTVLSLDDWQSGAEPYVMQVIAPFGASRHFAAETLTLLRGSSSANGLTPETGA